MPKFGFYQTEHRNNNFFSFVQKQMWERPEDTIFSWVAPRDLNTKNAQGELVHQRLKVKELGRMASKLGQGLLENAIRENDVVVILLPHSLQYLVTILGLQKIGAVPVMFQSWDDPHLISEICRNNFPVRAFISFARGHEYIQSIPEIQRAKIKIYAGESKFEKNKETLHLEDLIYTNLDVDTAPVSQEHSALIIYNTHEDQGTKGANRTHRMLAAQMYAFRALLPFESGDCDLTDIPIFNLYNLSQGICTVLASYHKNDDIMTNGQRLYDQIIENTVSTLSLSSKLMKALIQYCKENELPLPVRRIQIQNGTIPVDELINLKNMASHCEIKLLYSHFEIEPLAFIDLDEFLHLLQFKYQHLPANKRGIPIGKAMAGVNVKIIRPSEEAIKIDDFSDWDKYHVQNNKAGELTVATEHGPKGYFKEKEMDYQRKIIDDFSITWTRTRDLVWQDEDQNLWLLGPISDIVQSREDFYCVQQLETLVKSHFNISSLACIRQDNQNTLFIENSGSEGQKMDPNLQEKIQGLIKKEGLELSEIKLLAKLPKTSAFMNEIDKKQLASLVD